MALRICGRRSASDRHLAPKSSSHAEVAEWQRHDAALVLANEFQFFHLLQKLLRTNTKILIAGTNDRS